MCSTEYQIMIERAHLFSYVSRIQREWKEEKTLCLVAKNNFMLQKLKKKQKKNRTFLFTKKKRRPSLGVCPRSQGRMLQVAVTRAPSIL